jgi:hypothetical protein
VFSPPRPIPPIKSQRVADFRRGLQPREGKITGLNASRAHLILQWTLARFQYDPRAIFRNQIRNAAIKMSGCSFKSRSKRNSATRMIASAHLLTPIHINQRLRSASSANRVTRKSREHCRRCSNCDGVRIPDLRKHLRKKRQPVEFATKTGHNTASDLSERIVEERTTGQLWHSDAIEAFALDKAQLSTVCPPTCKANSLPHSQSL